ncbi:MAG: cupin domain-containing protein [Gemmatimonadaceae bacterium]|nr:cupin domain-containing protein [Gloeobacterales cyanobacterium ES-bin-141]
MSRFRRSLVVATSMLFLVGMPAVVSATPGTKVSGTILARGTSPDGIVVNGSGTTEVTIREITIAPGGSTGWHYHDGQLIAVVKSGTLTRTMLDCSTEVTPAGGSFVEPAGRHHTHVGRNLGTEPVVLLVTYVVPAGQQLSQDAPEPQKCAL